MIFVNKGGMGLIGLNNTFLYPCYTKCLLTQADMYWSLKQACIQVRLTVMDTYASTKKNDTLVNERLPKMTLSIRHAIKVFSCA